MCLRSECKVQGKVCVVRQRETSQNQLYTRLRRALGGSHFHRPILTGFLPGTVLGGGDAVVNKTKVLASQGVQSNVNEETVGISRLRQGLRRDTVQHRKWRLTQDPNWAGRSFRECREAPPSPMKWK